MSEAKNQWDVILEFENGMTFCISRVVQNNTLKEHAYKFHTEEPKKTAIWKSAAGKNSRIVHCTEQEVIKLTVFHKQYNITKLNQFPSDQFVLVKYPGEKWLFSPPKTAKYLEWDKTNDRVVYGQHTLERYFMKNATQYTYTPAKTEDILFFKDGTFRGIPNMVRQLTNKLMPNKFIKDRYT